MPPPPPVVDYICFPSPNYIFLDINAYNRGFPAQFLITEWWAQFPELQTALYIFAAFQMALSILGILMVAGKTVDCKQGIEVFATHKLLPLYNSTWQLALSGLILFIPTQWLSNITMAMILYHAWSEFFALVLRFMVVRGTLTPRTLDMFYTGIIAFGILTAVPFMLGSNPYIQGLITTIPVIPADFLNLFVAPRLAISWYNQNKNKSTVAEQVAELLTGLMSIIHVVWFYGQGALACFVSVYVGAQFFVAMQIINTLVFGAVIVSYVITIVQYEEWVQPKEQFLRLLLVCCYNGSCYNGSPHEDYGIKPTTTETTYTAATIEISSNSSRRSTEEGDGVGNSGHTVQGTTLRNSVVLV